MKILQFMEAIDLRRGGPPQAVIQLADVLAKRGHEVTVATANSRDIPEEWLRAPGSPKLLSLPPGKPPLRLLSRLGGTAFAQAAAQADVVHLHGIWEPMNLQVAAVCRRLGRPYIVTVRGMLDDWALSQTPVRKRLYLAMAGRRYLERAARVHCTAAAELTQARKWFPRGSGKVVPNLVDLSGYADPPDPGEAISRWPELDGKELIILFLGRIHPQKGTEALVDALGLMARKSPGGQKLVFAGTGDQRHVAALKERAEKQGLASSICWTGHVNGSLKRSLYAAADVFALPTSQESFGFVFFESLAAGTPVVTTDQVDTAAELKASGGVVIIPRLAAAFADTLNEFRDGVRDGLSLGRCGRAWVLRELATERVAEQFEMLYESCIREYSGPGNQEHGDLVRATGYNR
jgi:glycosyltransferase involved in cell wall biosynthesis